MRPLHKLKLCRSRVRLSVYFSTETSDKRILSCHSSGGYEEFHSLRCDAV
jgi:hypothetical protein